MLAIFLAPALAAGLFEPPAPVPVAATQTEFVVSSPVPTDFRPGDSEIELATKNFDAFWNLQQAGDFSAAYAMLSAENRAETTEADWTATQIRRLKEDGGDRERKLFRITWYPNPPSANAPGLYTALDFAAYTRNGGFRCSYVILTNAGTNPVQVTRVDMTLLPPELVSGPLPRADILSNLLCYLGPDVKTAFGKTNK